MEIISKANAVAALVAAVVGILASIVGYSVTYGRAMERLDRLEKQIEKLDGQVSPGPKLGDACMSMLENYIAAMDQGNARLEIAMKSRMESVKCFDRMQAATAEE